MIKHVKSNQNVEELQQMLIFMMTNSDKLPPDIERMAANECASQEFSNLMENTKGALKTVNEITDDDDKLFSEPFHSCQYHRWGLGRSNFE